MTIEKEIYENIEPKLPEEADATRISIISFLPEVFQEDPSGNLQPFLEVINGVIEQIRKYLIRFPRMLDIDEVPDRYILDLSKILGNDFDYFAPTDASKRKKVKALIDLYKHKGLDYSFRFIWQQYGIQKKVELISMSDHIMVTSQQGGLSVMKDKDAEYLSSLLLHDFGDNDLNGEWRGTLAADTTIWTNENPTYVTQGSYSGKGDILGVSWETVKVENITGYKQILHDIPGPGDTTSGWNYFGGSFDNQYIYFAPTDSTVFVRYNAVHQGNDIWKIYDTTAWDIIEQDKVIGISQQSAFYGSCFDGRYIYFAPYCADFFVRYDTQKSFSSASSWEKFSVGQLFPNLPNFLFTYCDFDGRWVYFSPNHAKSFVRFDTLDHGDTTTTESYFRNIINWETCDVDRAMRSNSRDATTFAYYGAVHEDDWVYFVPMAARKFIRFYRNGTFNDSSSWQQISKDQAFGYDVSEPITTFIGGVSDGRFIYFVPRSAEKFIRFDTAQNNFTDEGDWHKISIPLATDTTLSEDMFNGAVFDGQYIYFVPDKINYIVRYNTLSYYFQTESEWEHVHLSDILNQGVGNFTFAGGAYDGNYVYFSPLLAQKFVRYNTNSYFHNFKTNWEDKAKWTTTDWPRRFALNKLGDIRLSIYINDIDLFDTTSTLRFEIGLDSNNKLEFRKKLLQSGWYEIKFDLDHYTKRWGLLDSDGNLDLSNLGYATIELKLNPKNHNSDVVYFDNLRWVDPGTYKGLHGGYLQNNDIYHEGSIIINTNEWIEDNQTLKELIDDIIPLGFHPWIKFIRWFEKEITPDSTANETWLGVTRWKIFHRKADMNSTWLLANDTDFDLSKHDNVDTSWPPYNRHDSPGPYIVQRIT